MPIPEPTKRRGPIYAEFTGPGPLGYSLPGTLGRVGADPTRASAPAISLKPRLKDAENTNPGPDYTIGSNLTAKGVQENASYSFQSRPKVKPIEVSPGPGTYGVEKVKQGASSKEAYGRSITMATRARYPFKNEAPPPNTYTHPVGVGKNAAVCKSTPQFSMHGHLNVGRPEYSLIKSNVPGPGTYRPCDVNNVKQGPVSFSMQGRTKVKDYNTVKENPGPGSYNPIMLKREPSYSMGVRHSDFIVNVMSNLDLI